MRFVTYCPKCGTSFKVVADQLRIAQGWVRCGKCQTVYRAEETLSAVKEEASTEAPSIAALLRSRRAASETAATQASKTNAEVNVTSAEANADAENAFERIAAVIAAQKAVAISMAGHSYVSEDDAQKTTQQNEPSVSDDELPADDDCITSELVEIDEAEEQVKPLAVPDAVAESGQASAGDDIIESTQTTLDDGQQILVDLTQDAYAHVWDADDVDTPPASTFESTLLLSEADETIVQAYHDENTDAGTEGEEPTPLIPAFLLVKFDTTALTLEKEDVLSAAVNSEMEQNSVSLRLPAPQVEVLEDVACDEKEQPDLSVSSEPIQMGGLASDAAIGQTVAVDMTQGVRWNFGHSLFRRGKKQAAQISTTVESVSASQTSEQEKFSFVRHAKRRAFWRRLEVRITLILAISAGLLMLAAQWIYFERSFLYARMPLARMVLDAACKPLSCQIPPWQNIQAVVIDSSEFLRDSDRFYQFRMRLRNKSSHPVAMPALELILLDNDGQMLVRRVITNDLALPFLPPRGEWEEATMIEVLLPADIAPRTISGYRVAIFYP